jgi:hypothetical protein
MQTFIRRLTLSALALAAALTLAPAAASAAELFYTVGPENRLLSFTSDAPGALGGGTRIYGLQPGERIVGLDVRPDTEELYGVGSTSRVYRVNPGSGRALLVGAGAFPIPLQSTGVGMDFNPVADRLRIVDQADRNLRVNPNDGVVTEDGHLAYAAGDPAAGLNPNLTAIAYTDNTAQATTTTLLGIDEVQRTLVQQDPPNSGTLRTVGKLTIGGDPLTRMIGPVGFDIASDTVGYVTFRQGSGIDVETLYQVDLKTGALKLLGPVGPGLPALRVKTNGLAATGQVPDDRLAPLVVAAAPESQRLINIARRGLRFELSCNEACAVSASVRIRDSVLARDGLVLDSAGKANLRFRLGAPALRRVLRSRFRRITLQLVVEDAAGNRRRQSENVTLVP